MSKPRICGTCGGSEPESSFYETSNTRCKKCVIRAAAEYRKKHPDKSKATDWKGHLRRRYGLSVAQHAAMVKSQAGRCAICNSDQKPLVVDHCHTGGQVRALLCSNCNKALGLLGDNPEVALRASLYLLQHNAQPDPHT